MSRVRDLRRPDRRTAMKVLVKKSYTFVDTLWTMYVEQNKVDLRYVPPLVSADFLHFAFS